MLYDITYITYRGEDGVYHEEKWTYYPLSQIEKEINYLEERGCYNISASIQHDLYSNGEYLV